MPAVAAGLPQADSLHHKGSGFIQTPQAVLTLAVQHIVDTAVIEIAGTDLDGPL